MSQLGKRSKVRLSGVPNKELPEMVVIMRVRLVWPGGYYIENGRAGDRCD
jgi:hypothetical protein